MWSSRCRRSCSPKADATRRCSTTSATSRCCAAPKSPACSPRPSATTPPMPTAICAGPSTGPASTSNRPRSIRRRWSSRHARCWLSGVPFSVEPGTAPRGSAPAPAPRAWMIVAAVLLLGSVATIGAPATSLDWQPALVWREPWRAWTAAWVHYSALHLLANLVGGLVVVAFGIAARVPRRAAFAWLAAWPLTQAGLSLRPDLAHYGGLSGVLHAGVVVVAVHLIVEARGARRWVGSAGLLA